MTWLWVAWARCDDAHVAERLLRDLAVRRYGSTAAGVETVRICPRCASSSHGRPVLRGLSGPERPGVSVARAPGVTMVALAASVAVGVDVESTDAFATREVRDVLLHPLERAETHGEVARAWVRKEAVLKACGVGLQVDPASVRLDDSSGAPEVVETPAALRRPDWVADVDLAIGLTAAIAGNGSRPSDITVYSAGPGGRFGRATRRRAQPGRGRWTALRTPRRLRC